MVESINRISNNPYVATYDNFITNEECEHFITIAKPTLKRALVSSSSGGKISEGRSSSNTWIKHDHDEITLSVGKRIANIVKQPLENAEKFQIIYYDKDQEYRKHYDSWDHNGSEKTLRNMKYGGARLVTALCYLNIVEEGGGTNMTMLNQIISAKRGRLLVFHNTKMDSEGNHNKHPLSEHAGLPVIRGEKYAFNLWFRECYHTQLYKEFNPEYYDMENTELNFGHLTRLHDTKDIYMLSNYLRKDQIFNLLDLCNYKNGIKRTAWINKQHIIKLIKNLQEDFKFNLEYCENINVIEYAPKYQHNNFFDAYDITTVKGKKNTEKGQRIYSIVLFLSDHIEYHFPHLEFSYEFNKGDVLLYKNVLEPNRDPDLETSRDPDLEHRIVNKGNCYSYIANIYVREQLMVSMPAMTLKTEDYLETLNEVYTLFKEDKVCKDWSGYNSFKYLLRGDFDYFKQKIISLKDTKDLLENGSGLNSDNLESDYTFYEDMPLTVVNNVLHPDILSIFQIYYRETIDSNTWALGDRQSKRYKAHNEPMSRFLHYEILPLIERIADKKLRPTYTYLSAYIKDADLPGHTDKPDCEYTVSFIVDKPDGFSWPIYVHKKVQPVKHKGRYPENPPKEECEPVDCDVGGLMIFQGTDRIHFREKLEADYYTVLLLHYKSI